jgi:hypothetical protein
MRTEKTRPTDISRIIVAAVTALFGFTGDLDEAIKQRKAEAGRNRSGERTNSIPPGLVIAGPTAAFH